MDYVNASEFTCRALTGNYIGIPYAKLDCQAFVERVLADCGVKNPATGRAWNWRGSNHMWRCAVHDKRAITDGTPPHGAWLFTIKHDGGEKARGYHDNEGNAAHIGIYLGDGVVIHSTTGGVQWDNISSKRWTHYALANCVSYDTGAACECWRCKIRNRCTGGYAD